MEFEYLPKLKFADQRLMENIQKRSLRCVTTRQKWLGAFYSREMEAGYMPELVIKEVSPKIGLGAFANQDFPPQSFIGEYTGIVRRKKRRIDKKNDYCFEYPLKGWFWRSYLIDAEPAGNLTRFINHSDTPNLEPVSLFHGGLFHIVLLAAQFIPKGTQLSYDYGEDYWVNPRRIKTTL